ncbi:hypothetical protein M405DRAFT_869932 [Rhizopogon salebrosus TDB-379]|nr:hypothetical protein M405DRAFT_869932 [Rhizopogon salebrosus TDB-379]
MNFINFFLLHSLSLLLSLPISFFVTTITSDALPLQCSLSLVLVVLGAGW